MAQTRKRTATAAPLKAVDPLGLEGEDVTQSAEYQEASANAQGAAGAWAAARRAEVRYGSPHIVPDAGRAVLDYSGELQESLGTSDAFSMQSPDGSSARTDEQKSSISHLRSSGVSGTTIDAVFSGKGTPEQIGAVQDALATLEGNANLTRAEVTSKYNIGVDCSGVQLPRVQRQYPSSAYKAKGPITSWKANPRKYDFTKDPSQARPGDLANLPLPDGDGSYSGHNVGVVDVIRFTAMAGDPFGKAGDQIVRIVVHGSFGSDVTGDGKSGLQTMNWYWNASQNGGTWHSWQPTGWRSVQVAGQTRHITTHGWTSGGSPYGDHGAVYFFHFK